MVLHKEGVMSVNGKGFILPAAEAIPAKANDKVMVVDKKGQIQTVKSLGHPNLIELYPLLRPTPKYSEEQPQPSKYTTITLEIILPGGRIDEHFNETTAEMPACDLALYVVSGRMRVTLGTMEKIVGPETLIYLPTNVRRSLTNLGKGNAKFVRISGSAQEKKWGQPVYLKMPTWIGEQKRKVGATQNQVDNNKNGQKVLDENRNVFLLSVAEVVPIKAPDKIMVIDEKDQIQTIKSEGESKLLQFYPLLRPTAEFTKLQPAPSMYTSVTLGKMQPGGCIYAHYHMHNAKMPIYDHVFYVISGRMRVAIGDVEKTVGADTLIYCPSDMSHSLKNIGKGIAKYLTIRGTAEGTKMGGPVYSKVPACD